MALRKEHSSTSLVGRRRGGCEEIVGLSRHFGEGHGNGLLADKKQIFLLSCFLFFFGSVTTYPISLNVDEQVLSRSPKKIRGMDVGGAQSW